MRLVIKSFSEYSVHCESISPGTYVGHISFLGFHLRIGVGIVELNYGIENEKGKKLDL